MAQERPMPAELAWRCEHYRVLRRLGMPGPPRACARRAGGSGTAARAERRRLLAELRRLLAELRPCEAHFDVHSVLQSRCPCAPALEGARGRAGPFCFDPAWLSRGLRLGGAEASAAVPARSDEVAIADTHVARGLSAVSCCFSLTSCQLAVGQSEKPNLERLDCPYGTQHAVPWESIPLGSGRPGGRHVGPLSSGTR